jgi:hypothetical protein
MDLLAPPFYGIVPTTNVSGVRWRPTLGHDPGFLLCREERDLDGILKSARVCRAAGKARTAETHLSAGQRRTGNPRDYRASEQRPVEHSVTLLFENVKGYDLPLLLNSLGSAQRMAWALGLEDLDDLN